MDDNALLRLADKQGWTKQALNVLFEVATEMHCFEVVAKLAPVVVGQINKLKNSDDELVAMVLDALFEEELNDQRFELMHKLTELKQAKSLRSLGFQRLAMIEAQQGNEAKAREYIQQAIQADGKQPELTMCELTVLGFVGSEQELKAQAKYWLAFSLKRWGDDHPIVGFIEQVLSEGKALFEVDPDEYDISAAAYETAMQLAGAFGVDDLPFVQVLENSEMGTGLYLKSSLVKQKLAFMDAYEAQVQLLKEADGDGFQYDEYVAHSWNWPNLIWIDHLEKTPELLADFDVLNTLMPFVYQGPSIKDDIDAPLDDLSVFGLVLVLFDLSMHMTLKNTLDHLPENTQLPEELEANQGFWEVAFNVFMGLKEANEVSIAKEMQEQLLALTTNPPSWLVEHD